MSTISTCGANYTTLCAPCYIAASTAIHSFPYDLTTIEVEATPYIFPGNDGSSSTSWKYVTLTQTLHNNSSGNGLSPTATSDGLVFSHPTGVTWTTRDLTLTYPTTYVEYHDFSGVGADISNATACAQTDAMSQFILASETVEMSFVMQWMPTSTKSYPFPGPATSIPPQILSYLDTVPAVTSQLGGHPIESCLPANAPPECTSSLTNQTGECVSGCITGLPTSTMYYTNISTIVQPASVQTFTAYSWNSPSYSYSSLPETTIYSTSISATTLVNTKGNYTTVSCYTTCAAPALTTLSGVAPSTFKLTTASVLTTINKDPIFATVPAGIVDVEPTPSPPKPTPNIPPKPPAAKPIATPSPDPITVKPVVPNNQPTKAPSPTALPVENPQQPNDDTQKGPTPCADALCGLTAVDDTPPESTQKPTAGDDNEPEADQHPSAGNDNEPGSAQNPSAGDDNKPGSTQKPSAGDDNQPESVQSPSAGDDEEPDSTVPDGNDQNGKPNDALSGAIINVDSQEITASIANGGNLVIGTQTIAPGNALTLPDNQVISAGASATYIGGSKIVFSAVGGSQSTPFGVVFTDAQGQGRTATQISAGVFVAGSSTFTAGQRYTLQSGEVATVGPGGPLPSPGIGAVLTAGGQTITASAIGSGVFAIGGTTLSDGQHLTLSNGDIVHANSGGVQLGTSTIQFSALGAGTTTGAESFYSIGGQTLTPGGVITKGTATILLDRSGKTYYVNGTPTPVSAGIVSVDGTKYTAHTTADSTNVGDYIMEGISSAAARLTSTARRSGSGTESGPTATPRTTTGGAQELSAVMGCVVGLLVVAVAAIAL